MKISHITYPWRSQPETAKIEHYVEASLTRTDADAECAEMGRQIAGNTARAFGRLMETLATKGLLSAEEIAEVAGDSPLQVSFAVEPSSR